MTIPDNIARQIIHGTPRGYEQGCKSQGGCPNHESKTLMTCADAARAIRSDWTLHKLPQDEPFPKRAHRLARPAKRKQRTTPYIYTSPEPVVAKPATHGTVWGYQQGCTNEADCPNNDVEDAVTCAEARRRYRAEYSTRRLNGEGREIEHGTTAGYSAGCHDRDDCPGNVEGLTCADAARLADEARRRKNGIRPAAELTDSGPARAHLLAMQRAGLSLMKIVELTGVTKTAIRCLISGRSDYVDGRKGPRHGEIPARITVDKAQRILNTKIPEVAA